MLYYSCWDEKVDLHSDDEKLCAKLYIKAFDNIQKVKKQEMQFLENVEEARYMHSGKTQSYYSHNRSFGELESSLGGLCGASDKSRAASLKCSEQGKCV